MLRFALIATFMVGVYSQCKANVKTPCGANRVKVAQLVNEIPQDNNGTETFQCKYSGEEIPSSSKCNCIVDCYDRSDESEDTCGVGYDREKLMYRMVQQRTSGWGCSVCSLSHDIIHNAWLCDDIVDCLDRSDESYELCVEMPKQHYKNLTAQFPWTVSLGTRQVRHGCGGTIINNKWILTAAHCVDKVTDATKIKITAGDYNRTYTSGTEQYYAGEEVFVHEDYWRIDFNDIALIKVAGSIKFTDFIKPVDLPPPDKEFTGMASLAGWGSRWYKGKPRQVLRELNLPIVDIQECFDVFASIEEDWREITNYHICVGNLSPGTGACYGDSGSGLICTDEDGHQYVCGVTSFTGVSRCQGSKHPDVFTKVSKYIDWINSKMALYS